MKVDELQPGMKKIDVMVKVIRKGTPRSVSVKTDGKTHQVADLKVGDETGSISMSLWDDMIDQIQENDIILISNGYVSEFQGKLQLNIGKFGKWARQDPKEVSIAVDIAEVEADSTKGPAQFIKVERLLQQSRGVNLLVRVIQQFDLREITTRKDNKKHMIFSFRVGDETGCINFDLWDQGDDIAVGDVLELRGVYTREFNRILSLNLSRTGSYTKSSEDLPEVNAAKNLSESG